MPVESYQMVSARTLPQQQNNAYLHQLLRLLDLQRGGRVCTDWPVEQLRHVVLLVGQQAKGRCADARLLLHHLRGLRPSACLSVTSDRTSRSNTDAQQMRDPGEAAAQCMVVVVDLVGSKKAYQALSRPSPAKGQLVGTLDCGGCMFLPYFLEPLLVVLLFDWSACV